MDWYDDRDESWYEALYDDWKDDSYKYWYEGCDDDRDDDWDEDMGYIDVVEEEKPSYKLHFEDARFPGSGYSFPCTKDGGILWDIIAYPDIARKSLDYCKTHPERWTAETRDGLVVQIISRVREEWEEEEDYLTF